MTREALRGVDLFQTLSNSELELILGVSRRWRCKAGDVIFSEGEHGNRFYLILTGVVRISRDVPRMGEEALAVLKPGDFFGEMALIDDEPRSANAIANEDCVLLGIERDALHSLLRSDRDLAYSVLLAFSRTFSRRLRLMNERYRSVLALGGGR